MYSIKSKTNSLKLVFNGSMLILENLNKHSNDEIIEFLNSAFPIRHYKSNLFFTKVNDMRSVDGKAKVTYNFGYCSRDFVLIAHDDLISDDYDDLITDIINSGDKRRLNLSEIFGNKSIYVFIYAVC